MSADIDKLCEQLRAGRDNVDACEAVRLLKALGEAFEDTRAPVAQVTPSRRQTLEEQEETHRLLSVARNKMLTALNAPSSSAAQVERMKAEARAEALRPLAEAIVSVKARGWTWIDDRHKDLGSRLWELATEVRKEFDAQPAAGGETKR